MEDVTKRFRKKLDDLCALGRQNGMRLSVQKIQEVMKEEHLSASHLQLIYTYLDQMAIEIYDPELEEGSGAREARKRSLEVYLEELDRLETLSEESELQLFEGAAMGDKASADALIERYLTTVCDLSAEFEQAHPQVEIEDIVQEANIALVTGVGSLKKEESLAAYRVHLLNHVTACLEESVKNLEEVMNSDRRVVNRMNKLADTIRELEEELGHKPSIDELSAFLELPEEDIRNLLRVGGDDLKIDETPAE